MSETQAQILVAEGAAALDESIPGWHNLIDLDSLEMQDSCNCVVGQIAGRKLNLDENDWLFFEDALDEVFGERTNYYWARRHGFDATPLVEYDELAAEWTRVILERRAA